MWNSTFKSPSKPMSRSIWKKPRPRAIKSRGMKGKPTTAAEQRFHSQLSALGCIACSLDGREQPIVSIHHIDGRTKENAHWEVLPLCAGHHQDGTGAPGLIAVHPWKTRFEARYGTQYELLAKCMQMTLRILPASPNSTMLVLESLEGSGQ